MKELFVDTFYLVALLNSKDAWHDRVLAFSDEVTGCDLITTDEVLAEFLT